MKAFTLTTLASASAFAFITLALAPFAANASVPVNGGMESPGTGDSACAASAETSLNKKGITDATLVQVQVRRNGSEIPTPSGYDFYYSSPSCGGSGYLVVTTTDYCYTQQVYTRFSCQIPGVSHFGF